MAMDSAAVSVDQQRLQRHIRELACGPRHGLYNQDAHAKAIEYILGHFSGAGLEVVKHTFDGGDRQGLNLIGRKQGNDGSLPTIMVSAHYDTVPGSPGADDNANGVAALLEAARILGAVSVRRSVELVAFDMEEVQPDSMSLVGSGTFVKSMVGEGQYEGVYNLEMIGYASGPNTQGYPPGFGVMFPRVLGQVQARDFRGDFIAVVSQGPGIAFGRRLEEAARQWAPELHVVQIEAPRSHLPLLPDVFRSDHVPFWLAGIPAVMVTDTADFRNPNYHQPFDTPATLDLEFLTRVARSVIGAVMEHAEATFPG